MENVAHVVGPDAPIADSKMVKPDLGPRTAIGQLLVCPSYWNKLPIAWEELISIAPMRVILPTGP